MSKIDEWLDIYTPTGTDGHSAQYYYEKRKIATQQLLALLEACKPEKLREFHDSYCPVVNNCNCTAKTEFLINQATQQYHSNIRKLFEVER